MLMATRVLELGFGAGDGLKEACKHVRTPVVGVEMSDQMIGVARRKLSAEVAKGQVALIKGSALSLPFPDNSFDRVVHMNVAYFFNPLDETLREIKRVLAPGGIMISGMPASSTHTHTHTHTRTHTSLTLLGTKFHIVAGNDPAIFTNRNKDAYMSALREAGFADVASTDVRFGTTEEQKRWAYQAISSRKP